MIKNIKLTIASEGAEQNYIKIKFSLLAKGANEFAIDTTNSQIKKDELKKGLINKLDLPLLPDVININNEKNRK